MEKSWTPRTLFAVATHTMYLFLLIPWGEDGIAGISDDKQKLCFKIECPTGSGIMMNLFEVARDLAEGLSAIFTKNEENKRPVYGAGKTKEEVKLSPAT